MIMEVILLHNILWRLDMAMYRIVFVNKIDQSERFKRVDIFEKRIT